MQKPITIVKCLLLLLNAATAPTAAVAAEPAAATIWCTLYRKAITLIMRLQNQKTQSHWRRQRRVCTCVCVCMSLATHTRHFRLPNPIYAAKRGVPPGRAWCTASAAGRAAQPRPQPVPAQISVPLQLSLAPSLHLFLMLTHNFWHSTWLRQIRSCS